MPVIRNGIITELDTTANLDTDDAALVATRGTTAPSSTPAYIGAFYIDTSAKKLYFSVGTTSSSDWIIAN